MTIRDTITLAKVNARHASWMEAFRGERFSDRLLLAIRYALAGLTEIELDVILTAMYGPGRQAIPASMGQSGTPSAR